VILLAEVDERLYSRSVVAGIYFAESVDLEVVQKVV
jgi:hypothetical protein